MNDFVKDELVCSNPECKVHESGKCIEGFENIRECPHINLSAKRVEESSDAEKAIDRVDEEADHVDKFSPEPDTHISSGEGLTVNEAEKVLRNCVTRVISIIGPIGCGKTTLGLSLYEAFQEQPFGEYSFAGSLTLPSFEQRCHLARLTSGRQLPDTARTPHGDGLRFMHIAVCNAIIGKIQVLITDRSGEFYTSLSKGQEGIHELPDVRRADKVLILVDGKRLLDDERHAVKTNARMTIETLLDLGAMGSGHRLGILLTKYDLVKDSSLCDRAENDFNDLVASIKDRFGRKVQDINSFKIASRSTSSNVDSRYGLLEVLQDAISGEIYDQYVPQVPELPDRNFLRFNIIEGSNH